MANPDDLANPALVTPAASVTSCEHCRTVTWAGVPACSCEFGRLAIDEIHTRMLCDASVADRDTKPLS